MSTNKIITIALTVFFLILAGVFGYMLVDGIKSNIDTKNKIAREEAAIIKKLEIIREAQINYQKFYGKYAGDWDSLKSFVDTGFVYLTEKTETVIPLEYGRDSIVINIDTLGTKRADSMILWSFIEEDLIMTAETDTDQEIEDFKAQILPNFSMIPPENEQQFELYSGMLERKNSAFISYVPVFEVRDVDPINPERRDSQNPLQVGSRVQVTTSGNWNK